VNIHPIRGIHQQWRAAAEQIQWINSTPLQIQHGSNSTQPPDFRPRVMNLGEAQAKCNEVMERAQAVPVPLGSRDLRNYSTAGPMAATGDARPFARSPQAGVVE
jgi:hypothetical protein